MKSRVNYLEKAQEKMESRMNVMRAQIQHRERAIAGKDEDLLRNALRAKRDEVLERERKAKVNRSMIEKAQGRALMGQERDKREQQIKLKKLYDRMLVSVERQMNDEIELAEKVELQDAEKLETIRQAQAQVWREQFATNATNPQSIERTIQAMGDYME